MNTSKLDSGPTARLMAVIPLLLSCSLVLAQDSSAEEFMKCARETDEIRRLACFDRVASLPSVQESAPAVPAPANTVNDAADLPGAAPAAPTAVAAEPVPAPRPEAVAVPAQAPVSPAPSAVPAAAASSAAPAATASPAPAPASPVEDSGDFAAVVRRIDIQPRGEHVVFLENGQVWQENVKTSYFPVEIGDTVTIRERKFGGHRLVTESGRAYSVKRLR